MEATKLVDVNDGQREEGRQERKGVEKRLIVFLPFDAHGHTNSMLSLATELKLIGHETVFICVSTKVPELFGHKLIQLSVDDESLDLSRHKEKANRSEKSPQGTCESLLNEQQIFLGLDDDEEGEDSVGNNELQMKVDLFDYNVSLGCDNPRDDHRSELVLKSLAQNFGIMKMAIEMEQLPLDDRLEQLLLDLGPDLVVVDQLFPRPAVLRLAQKAYCSQKSNIPSNWPDGSLRWLSFVSCNPLSLYYHYSIIAKSTSNAPTSSDSGRIAQHQLHQQPVPPPLMGVATNSKGVDLEVAQLRFERAIKSSGLVETLIKMAIKSNLLDPITITSAGTNDLEICLAKLVLNRSDWLNLYMFPAELDYDKVLPLCLPSNQWLRADSLIRPSRLSAYDNHCLGEVSNLRKQIISGGRLIYVSLGTVISTNLVLMEQVLRQVFVCLHSRADWYFVIALGSRAKDLLSLYDGSLSRELDYWQQQRARLLARVWWPQPELFRQHLVDCCVTHGGNNTICEIFSLAKRQVVPRLVIIPGVHDQLDTAQRIQELQMGVVLTASRLMQRAETASEAGDGCGNDCNGNGILLLQALDNCMKLDSTQLQLQQTIGSAIVLQRRDAKQCAGEIVARLN